MKDKIDADRIASVYTENTATGKLKKEIQKSFTETSNVEEFQKLINDIDKKLPYEGRMAIREVIENINKEQGKKIILTPEEEKIKELRKKLDGIKNNWIHPRDKYDSGLVQSALRAFANIQKVIGEAFDYVRKNLEGHQKSEKQNIKLFNNLIIDAYKDKGQMLAFALNNKIIDKETAKDLFIKDMGYIEAQGKDLKDTLKKTYADNLTNALNTPDISIQTKNTVLEMILAYQKGEFSQKINEYAKKGVKWQDFGYDNANNEQQAAGDQKTSTQKNSTSEKPMPSKKDLKKASEKASVKESAKDTGKSTQNTTSPNMAADPIRASKGQKYEPQTNKTIEETDLIEKAVEIGASFSVHDYDNADKAIQSFSERLNNFFVQHPDLSKEDKNQYARIAISVLSVQKNSKDRIWKNMDEHFKQYDSKDFRSSSDSSRAALLINAAGTISFANSLNGKNGENIANVYAIKTIERALANIEDLERQQNFISGIADKVKLSHAQYLLAMDAKKLGLRAEEHDGRGIQYRMNRQADALADKYRKPPKNPNYSTLHEFIAFCDRLPESMGGAQNAYDMLKERLETSPLLFKKLENDREAYNELNNSFGLNKISNIEVAEHDSIVAEADFDPEFDEQYFAEWSAALDAANERRLSGEESIKKYELTRNTMEYKGHRLHQIKALMNFGVASKGDLGGWIEKESNLSQDGNAWVSEDGKVYGDAKVFDNALVGSLAEVYGNAKVYGNAMVHDNAEVFGEAELYDNTEVSGKAKVHGDTMVADNAKVFDNAEVCGNACVSDNAKVYDNAWVGGDALVYGDTLVYGDDRICGNDRVSYDARDMER